MVTYIHTLLNDQSRQTQINVMINIAKKAKDSGTFSEIEHKHDEPITSHDYVHIHESIIDVTRRFGRSTYQ